MRLGQLARKLDIETNDIVKYLKKQDIIIDNHLNTKLEDEQIELITKHFYIPEEVKEVVVVETPEVQPVVEEVEIQEEEITIEEETEIPEAIEEIVEVEETVVETPEIISEEEIVVEQTPVSQPINLSGVLTVMDLLEKAATEEPTPLVELSRDDKVPEDSNASIIRAPKIELQGFKVLGKIELPEDPRNKKKEEAKAEETTPEETAEISNDTPAQEQPIEVVATHTPHPTKKTKILNVEKEFIDDSFFKEEVVEKPKSAKEIKLAKKKGKKKKVVVKEATPEEIAKTTLREKRKRQRKNTKEAAKKNEKHWLKRLWDAIK